MYLRKPFDKTFKVPNQSTLKINLWKHCFSKEWLTFFECGQEVEVICKCKQFVIQEF